MLFFSVYHVFSVDHPFPCHSLNCQNARFEILHSSKNNFSNSCLRQKSLIFRRKGGKMHILNHFRDHLEAIYAVFFSFLENSCLMCQVYVFLPQKSPNMQFFRKKNVDFEYFSSSDKKNRFVSVFEIYDFNLQIFSGGYQGSKKNAN